MSFSNTDPFLRAVLDAIGLLAQRRAGFKEISLRLSISRQDIYWRIRAADDYAHDFQRVSSKPVNEERYYQETKALFGFFTSALSALECFFFAAYFVGMRYLIRRRSRRAPFAQDSAGLNWSPYSSSTFLMIRLLSRLSCL
jgi:hypothetical protein